MAPLPRHTAARTQRLFEKRLSFHSRTPRSVSAAKGLVVVVAAAAEDAAAFRGPRDIRTGNPPTTALIGILAPLMILGGGRPAFPFALVSGFAFAFLATAASEEGDGRSVRTCTAKTSTRL